MHRKSVIVIGGGVGGLTAAMLLAARDVQVTLLEKEADVGGKMSVATAAGRSIDAGPTVLTMLPVFTQLFADCGLDLNARLKPRKAEVIARHAWDERQRLDLFADKARSADAIGQFAGAGAARGFLDFCAHARDVYATMDPLFMRAARPTPGGMVRNAGLSGLRGLISSAPFSTLWNCLGRYFHDPRLRQLFGRYATYCGSSPFAAPATLALIAHVELDGVWIVEGGMAAFARVFRDAAIEAGVRIRTGTQAAEIETRNARATGVRLSTGEHLPASAVIANCEAGALAAGLLGQAGRAAVTTEATTPRSLSAATWAIVATAGGFPLAHHTVLFSQSAEREFGDLFERGRWPADPTVYICAQDRTDSGAVSESPERLLAIVNAPADGGHRFSDPMEIKRCRQAMMTTLQRCGLNLKVVGETHAGPAHFAARFPGSMGAIYGMASHGWTASFRRPDARSRIAGLYLAGGSVHPGAGLPMVALSGRAAASAAWADMAST